MYRSIRSKNFKGLQDLKIERFICYVFIGSPEDEYEYDEADETDTLMRSTSIKSRYRGDCKKLTLREKMQALRPKLWSILEKPFSSVYAQVTSSHFFSFPFTLTLYLLVFSLQGLTPSLVHALLATSGHLPEFSFLISRQPVMFVSEIWHRCSPP